MQKVVMKVEILDRLRVNLISHLCARFASLTCGKATASPCASKSCFPASVKQAGLNKANLSPLTCSVDRIPCVLWLVEITLLACMAVAGGTASQNGVTQTPSHCQVVLQIHYSSLRANVDYNESACVPILLLPSPANL